MRHLLRVSGVSSIIYWLQFFLFDAVVFLIPCILMLILIPAFQLPSLSPAPAMGSLVLCILLYCPSGILFSYLCSFMFGKWETAQLIMPQLFLFVSKTKLINVFIVLNFSVGVWGCVAFLTALLLVWSILVNKPIQVKSFISMVHSSTNSMRGRRRLVFLASFYRVRERNTRRRGPVSIPLLLHARPRNFFFGPEKNWLHRLLYKIRTRIQM